MSDQDRTWVGIAARQVLNESLAVTALELIVGNAPPDVVGMIINRLRAQVEFGVEKAPQDVKQEARCMLEALLHGLTRNMQNVAPEDRPRVN